MSVLPEPESPDTRALGNILDDMADRLPTAPVCESGSRCSPSLWVCFLTVKATGGGADRTPSTDSLQDAPWSASVESGGAAPVAAVGATSRRPCVAGHWGGSQPTRVRGRGDRHTNAHRGPWAPGGLLLTHRHDRVLPFPARTGASIVHCVIKPDAPAPRAVATACLVLPYPEHAI